MTIGFPKFKYVRDKAYLRLVAALPCQLCGAGAPSQAAHSNQAIHGKGRSVKASDVYTAALCQPCHYEIDQGKNLSREERSDLWNKAYVSTLKALYGNN